MLARGVCPVSHHEQGVTAERYTGFETLGGECGSLMNRAVVACQSHCSSEHVSEALLMAEKRAPTRTLTAAASNGRRNIGARHAPKYLARVCCPDRLGY